MPERTQGQAPRRRRAAAGRAAAATEVPGARISLRSAPGPLVCGFRRPSRVSLECPYLGLGVQGDDFLVVVQQLAGVGDVNGRFLFVAGEDPNLQAGLPQSRYGLGNAVLQAVFDPSGAWAEAWQCVGRCFLAPDPGGREAPAPPHSSCHSICRWGPAGGPPPVAARVVEGVVGSGQRGTPSMAESEGVSEALTRVLCTYNKAPATLPNTQLTLNFTDNLEIFLRWKM